jgi:hypothetical protein
MNVEGFNELIAAAKADVRANEEVRKDELSFYKSIVESHGTLLKVRSMKQKYNFIWKVVVA